MDLNINENVCRLCANHGKMYQSIFDSKNSAIAVKINNCLPIEIREDDRLPSHICPGCLEALDISDKLRAQSLAADEILRQQLRVVLIDKIKQEKDADADDESQPMDTTERLFCGICEINFDGTTEFDDHMKIREDDRLPSHICPGCLEALDISDKLRAQSLAADEILRQQLRVVLIDKIKQEKDADADDESQPMDTTERLFCGICEINFDGTTEFDDHMKASHSSQWICDLCHEDCKTSEDLLRHKYKDHYDSIDQNEGADVDLPKDSTINHPQRTEDPDDDVTESFEVKEENLLKVESTEGQQQAERENVECHVCSVTIATESLMPIHLKMHENRQITCPTCSLEFPSPYDLVTHKQIDHKVFVGQTMKWFCDKCERFASNVQFLKRHKFCTKVKMKCKYCTLEFFQKSELQIHQKRNHFEDVLNDPDSEKWVCGTCGKSYVEKGEFNAHIRNHQARDEGRFTCPTCGKTFSNAANMKAHFEVKHEKQPKYPCDVCSKSFCNSKTLYQHKKRHADQTCQECGQHFETVRLLTAHLLTKHNISLPSTGNYCCKICGMRFKQLKLLRDHKNTHTGIKPPAIRYVMLLDTKPSF
ncbi:zinc finger protein 624 [Diachasma alloeum]|uniref:zinc finger protein 624 n=1 Tax=Diachasma alloeum TaxID=454923 RepID=UPI0007384C42|nr:zinc finger protein 624 [Diachasma alloeum]